MPLSHKPSMHRPDAPSTLGCSQTGRGVQFNVLSSSAERMELCLFAAPTSARESVRIEMVREGDVFRAHVDGVSTGTAYGFRAHGPFEPAAGLRHNPNKLLLDPYGRRVVGPLSFHPAQLGSLFDDQGQELGPDPHDSAAVSPRSVVTDCHFEWGDERRPHVPWSDTLLYECHVKGMTALHPDVRRAHRGSYLGLTSPAVIAHLKALGVTSVSLLPVHERYSDRHLTELGLSNYWGYATLGFFAPRADFASVAGAEISEFKQMVRALHAAGIEVILDVVYNHSAESDRFGPTLCLRGLDNRSYYRLRPDAPDHYENYSGCGNTLDLRNRTCRALVLDSLRYWAQEMRVDGFRFDLAVALSRGDLDHERDGAFLSALRGDPVLAPLKLIVEPWDLGPHGYRLGDFPAPAREWNDRFRDDARRFVRGDDGARAQLATRLAGSSDIFDRPGRVATSGINFVACHDGFTLWDTVSHDHKHNEANGEHNRDGHDYNLSRNWGVEGETEDPLVLQLRGRAARAFLLLLGLSKGVPMLAHGDELGRTQRGNNNAYAQDNPLSWVDWSDRAGLLPFARAVFALRRRHPALRDDSFLHGDPLTAPTPSAAETASATTASPAAGPQAARDLVWLGPDGRELTHDAWQDPAACTLAMLIRAGARSPLAAGVDFLLCILHAGDTDIDMPLPWASGPLHCVLDTAHPGADLGPLGGGVVRVAAHGALVIEGLSAASSKVGAA